MAENKDKKVLNVPNKREITPNELGSAEHKEVRLKRNIPNLRFKEFSGEWEEKRLGEIGESFIGLTYKPTDIVAKDGIIVFRSSNIQNGVIDYKDIVRVDRKVKEKLITKKDDLLVCARNGSTRLIGKNALLKEVDSNQTFGAFMMVFRSDKNRFVHQLLNTKRYMSQISENLGARINQITSADLYSFKFFFPQNYEEIQKIASFLDLLDERIATQNKIIEELKKLKNGISDKLFKSIKGAVKPLSSICEIIKGKQINGEFLTDKGEYYVMNGGVEPSGYFDNYNVEADTISISEGGNSCGYVQFNTSPFWSGGHCYTIQEINSTIDNSYLYHYLKSNEDKIMKLRIGTGLPNIQKKDLANFKIVIPEMEKQKNISNLLSLLERKIENSIVLLSCLQSQKQHLLRQMFI